MRVADAVPPFATPTGEESAIVPVVVMVPSVRPVPADDRRDGAGAAGRRRRADRVPVGQARCLEDRGDAGRQRDRCIGGAVVDRAAELRIDRERVGAWLAISTFIGRMTGGSTTPVLDPTVVSSWSESPRPASRSAVAWVDPAAVKPV